MITPKTILHQMVNEVACLRELWHICMTHILLELFDSNPHFKACQASKIKKNIVYSTRENTNCFSVIHLITPQCLTAYIVHLTRANISRHYTKILMGREKFKYIVKRLKAGILTISFITFTRRLNGCDHF